MPGFGYIDPSGKMVLPTPGRPFTFNEGLARVSTGTGDWTFIDPGGKVRLQVKQAWSGFFDGLAQTDRGFVDPKGKVVLPIQYKANFTKYVIAGATYNNLSRFGSGLLWTMRTGHPKGDAYLNKSGKVVLDGFQGGLAGPFQDGKALVQIQNPPPGERYRRIDPKGRCLASYSWHSIGQFSDGLGMISVKGKIGFIDDAGDLVLKPTWRSWFTDLSECFFREGLAPMKVGRKWGFIDRKGRMAIRPQFDEVQMGFSEGLAAVRVKKLFGYVDRKGKMVIAPQFESALPFSHGLAAVELPA